MNLKTKAILATLLVILFIIGFIFLACLYPVIIFTVGLIIIGICSLILLGFFIWQVYDYFYYIFKNNNLKE